MPSKPLASTNPESGVEVSAPVSAAPLSAVELAAELPLSAGDWASPDDELLPVPESTTLFAHT